MGGGVDIGQGRKGQRGRAVSRLQLPVLSLGTGLGKAMWLILDSQSCHLRQWLLSPTPC